MKTALIISGGEYSPSDISIEYDYAIACDRGYLYARDMGIVPNVIIGDFDSAVVPETECEVVQFPVRKDDTDTMLAIKHALSKGYMHIVIICALGGRLDHTLANIQSMHYVAHNGGVCEIISESEHLRTLTGPGKVDILGSGSATRTDGYSQSLSLFSLTDVCDGLSITGTEYDVQGVTLTNAFPLGYGNKVCADKAVVELESGILLISESKYKE